MTHKELKKLRYLHREMLRMEKDVMDAIEKYHSTRVCGTVMASRPELPYDLHPVTVQGADWTSGLRTQDLARKALDSKERALYRCVMEYQRLNQYIDNIRDDQTRGIFDLYYRRKKTWQQVAVHFGWTDESWPRKISKKYFEESEKSDFDDVKLQ